MKTISKGIEVGLMAALITFMASPAFARSISFEGAGTALWIFIFIGAVIILLQLIPATLGFKRGKKVEEEVTVAAPEPVVVKK
jgi:hypothetical protein